jgi:hypothetical protein
MLMWANYACLERSTEKEEQKTDRCKKQYASTNDLVMTSVLLNKSASVLAQLRFKKEDVSLGSWKLKSVNGVNFV